MVVFGRFWSFLVLFGSFWSFWSFLVVFGRFWSFLVLFGPLQINLAVYFGLALSFFQFARQLKTAPNENKQKGGHLAAKK